MRYMKLFERIRKTLMKYPNVIGISNNLQWKIIDGKETDIGCIRVYVSKKLPPIQCPLTLTHKLMIPKEIGGIPTDVVEIGTVRALEGKKEMVEPLVAGISIGHKDITAGTLGWFYYQEPETSVVLGSNAHIFTPDASKPNGTFDGDEILQPGPYEEGSKRTIGKYLWHKQIKPSSLSSCKFSNGIASVLNGLSRLFGRKSRFNVSVEEVNYIDFATCTLLEDFDMKCFDFDPIEEGYSLIGHVFAGSEQVGVICKIEYILSEGWFPIGIDVDIVKENDVLRKSGRTSCDTTFGVTDQSAYLQINYGSFMAAFNDVILVDNTMEQIQGGDSGSSVFKGDDY